MKKSNKIVKTVLWIVGIILAALILFVIYLTVREFRPEPVEKVEGVLDDGLKVSSDESLTILSYNTGYAGLSKEQDFFMDGGTKVQPESKSDITRNLEGITEILSENPADVYFLQEADVDSKRSFHIDQTEYYKDHLYLNSYFAANFKCDFVPYPLPPIGKVHSGLQTLTKYNVSDATRISLPESFAWPVKTCNLKRCMLETRFPIQNSDKELVLINFHLEAYDSGEGKIAQSKMLAETLQKEYEKGNYVIAGGDFNQTFEDIDKYPITDKGNWVPGVISSKDLPEHFSFATDDTYPTCRLLNKPYGPDSQVYVIDGFIVSDNINVENVEVINTDFEFTDHQPVKLQLTLN